jgi:hypothetical protein
VVSSNNIHNFRNSVATITPSKLFHFDSGDITSSQVKEYSSNTNIGSVVSATIDTSTYKFGTGSLYCSGSIQRYFTFTHSITPSNGFSCSIRLKHVSINSPYAYALWIKTGTSSSVNNSIGLAYNINSLSYYSLQYYNNAGTNSYVSNTGGRLEGLGYIMS